MSLFGDVAVQVFVRGVQVNILTVKHSLVPTHGHLKVPQLSAEEVNLFLSHVQMTAHLHIEILTVDHHDPGTSVFTLETLKVFFFLRGNRE
jgi:hypothetical protein